MAGCAPSSNVIPASPCVVVSGQCNPQLLVLLDDALLDGLADLGVSLDMLGPGETTAALMTQMRPLLARIQMDSLMVFQLVEPREALAALTALVILALLVDLQPDKISY